MICNATMLCCCCWFFFFYYNGFSIHQNFSFTFNLNISFILSLSIFFFCTFLLIMNLNYHNFLCKMLPIHTMIQIFKILFIFQIHKRTYTLEISYHTSPYPYQYPQFSSKSTNPSMPHGSHCFKSIFFIYCGQVVYFNVYEFSLMYFLLTYFCHVLCYLICFDIFLKYVVIFIIYLDIFELFYFNSLFL
jgi:hypothetical protein